MTITVVIFDWGDTLMRDLRGYSGPMYRWPEVHVIPGVAEALEEISGQQFRCCVASNAGDSNADLLALALERVNIKKHFEHIFTSTELGCAKPDPRFFLAIANQLQVDATSCLAVGNDYEKDVVPAAKVGMKTVLLCEDNIPREAPMMDHGIRSMRDLPACLPAR